MLCAYLLLLLVVLRDLENSGHVFAKVELLERCFDVLAGYCLLRVLFGNLIGFGGDECDEFDAAFYEKVSGVLRKGHARFSSEDILDDLLHSRWVR